MTNSKWNLAMVGGFVLLGLTSLVLTLALLAGRTGSTDDYYTIYTNVSGLKFGSKVLFEGYPVGQVEEIEPYEEQGRLRFRVRLSVIEGWKIPEDSLARSVASGVLAPQTIDISAGVSPKTLQPGAIIKGGGAGGLMSTVENLAGNVDEITDEALLPLLKNINEQVTLLGTILKDDIRPLAQNSNKVMAAASEDVPQILANLQRLSERTDRMLSPQRVEALGRTIDNADTPGSRTGEKVVTIYVDSFFDARAGDLFLGKGDGRSQLDDIFNIIYCRFIIVFFKEFLQGCIPISI